MPRTEEHFIWTDDYAQRLDVLASAVQQAANDKTPRLVGEGDPYAELVEEYEALKTEAEEAGHRLVVRGLRDDEWDELVEAHPPRTEGPHAEGDKALGMNEKTGLRALIYASLVEPRFESRTRFDDWIRDEGIARGELTVLGMKAFRLTNGGGLTDPKSLPPLPTPDDAKS